MHWLQPRTSVHLLDILATMSLLYSTVVSVLIDKMPLLVYRILAIAWLSTTSTVEFHCVYR